MANTVFRDTVFPYPTLRERFGDEERLLERLHLFYGGIVPRFMQVTSEDGSSQVCFVDGDALLAELVSDPRVSSTYCGQPLHVVYQAERLLQSLVERGANCKVVFFECYAAFWSAQPNFAALRSVLKAHLTRLGSEEFSRVTVLSLPNWYDGQYERLLDSDHPSFVALSAVESLRCFRDAGEQETFAFLQRSCLVFLLRWAQHVIFLGEVEFREFQTFAFTCAENRQKLQPQALPSLNALCDRVVASLSSAGGSGGSTTLDELVVLAHRELQTSEVDVRASVAAAACRQVLSDGDADADALAACKLYLVHVVLLGVLGVTERVFHAADDQVPQFGSFYSKEAPDAVTAENRARVNSGLVDRVGRVAALGAHGVVSAVRAGLDDVTGSLIDSFDGRLLDRMVEWRGACSEARLGLGEPEMRQLKQLYGFAVATTKFASEPLFPVASDVDAATPLATFSAPSRQASETVPDMRTRLLSEFLGDAKTFAPREPVNYSRVGAPLENFIIRNVKANKEPEMSQVKSMRMHQKLLNFVHRQAESLEGTAIFERENIIQVKDLPIAESAAAASASASSSAAAAGGEAGPSGGAAEKKPLNKKEQRELKEQEKAAKKAAKVSHSTGGGHGGKKGGTEKKETMKEKILRESNEAKHKAALERAMQQWQNQLEQVNRSRTLDEQIRLIELVRAPNRTAPQVYFEATFKMLELYESHLNQTREMRFGGLIFDVTFELLAWFQEQHDIIEPKLQRLLGQRIAGILFDIGLETPAVYILHEMCQVAHADVRKKIESDRNMLAKQMAESDDDDDDDDDEAAHFDKNGVRRCKIETSHVRFQLEHMGERLTRERGIADERVQVRLDRWQKPVLDLMDARDSALICAPTSSGKTFLSYYLMKNVLKDGTHPRGTLVFVSPTKALVNQVEAQIFRMFGSVYGVFTEKYQREMDTCRILVTTPECLEALLLSPYNRNFVERIRYAIFDEIHTINGELGQFWERLLLLLPCPFVALSATVGNPDVFCRWLQEMENEKKRLLQSAGQAIDRTFVVRKIEHKERFADLRHFVFLSEPPSEGSTEYSAVTDPATLKSIHVNESQLSSSHDLLHLHPCAAVPLEVLRETGFPSELNFEPRDTLQLFDCMSEVGETVEEASELMEPLDPDTFFEKDIRLSRSRVREYERALKEMLYRWGRDFPALQAEVMRRLGSQTVEKIVSNEKAWSRADKPVSSIDTIAHNLFDLVLRLDARDMLPAIAFNFDRFVCEKLAIKLYEQFERGEAHDRQRRSGEINAKLKQFETWKRRKAEQLEQLEKAKSEAVKLELQRKFTVDNELGSEFESFDPDAEVENYILNRAHQRLQPQEWTQIMWDIKRKMDTHSLLVKMLRRGVGVHHAGLPRKYLQSVEIMFRKGQLRIVFATSTLALGIHMPCRTVIFAGDSQLLNPMEFRQMEGRAGRRGYDLKGNVVFFGVPNHKIRKLLTAPVSDLRGRFPFRTSNLLRMHSQYHHLCAEKLNSEFALSGSLVMLRKPLYLRDDVDILQQTKLFMRRAGQFLVEMGYSNRDGTLTGSGDLAQFFYDEEPSNFALLAVLSSESLSKMCETPSAAVDQMCIVLASILARIPAHPALLCSPVARQLSALGVLPALPNGVEGVLLDYNYDTLGYYFQAVRDFCAQLERKSAKLPLSGREFALKSGAAAAAAGTVRAALQSAESQIDFCCCSPFVALSGVTDEFTSFEDLLHNVRDGIYLDKSSVPIVQMLHPFSQRPMLVNAAVADYFRQGSRSVLVNANGISSEDIFTILQTFRRMLEGIAAREKDTKMTTLLHLRKAHTFENKLLVSDYVMRTLDKLVVDFVEKYDRTAEKQEKQD